jgi:hypothetical protein
MRMLGAAGLEKPWSVKTALINEFNLKEKWKESKRKTFIPNLTWMKELIISVSGVKGEYKNQKKGGLWMAFGLDPKQIVLNDELLLSQVVSQEAVLRLLVERGIFSKEEFWEMVEVVSLEIKKIV